MQAELPKNDDYELWVLIHQARDAIAAVREKEVQKFGISMVEARVLLIVKAIEKPATPSEIARWLFRKSHTVSQLMVRMEEKGLIRRTKDLERKNMIRISLTAKGEEALQQSMELKSIHNIFSCLSREERDALRGYLEKLRNTALEEPEPMNKKPPFP
jgi:DNA-binding MarR family transcriptional regulator